MFTPDDATNYLPVIGATYVTVVAVTVITSYAAFPTGSSNITKSGKAVIKKIVSKSANDAKYTVIGIANKSTGVSNSRIKALAKTRAEKVKAYLIKIGVKRSNISIKFYIVASGVTAKTKILAKYTRM